MNDDTRVALVKLETKFDAFRDLVGEWLKARDKALDLQSSEYRRRLNDLNGEQARIAKSQETYISREVFENFARDYRIAHEDLKTVVATLTEKVLTGQSLLAGRSTGSTLFKDNLFAILALLIALASLLLRWK